MGCDITAYVEVSYADRPHCGWNQLGQYRFGRDYVLFALMAGVQRYSMFPTAETLEQELTKRGVEKLDDPRLSDEEVSVIVRDACDTGITKGVSSFEAKGCPRDISYHTTQEWTYSVIDDGRNTVDPRTVERTKATEYVAKGYAEAWEELDGELLSITDSDLHTPSWLSTEEVGELVTRFHATLEGYVDSARKEQEMGIRWATAGLKRARGEDDPEAIASAEAELERAQRWSTYDPLRSETFAKVQALHAMMTALESKSCLKARVVFWFDN